ncbi:hypothetical protein GXP67_03465 [Rhodocytophaga rosea]|uniref:Uncharacterized protein n=1 Tax=Rhodocytophaga rosea TaxID=2704465 RepID=A0A6C0GD27_9BACT|nr:hypothetical protein [Rhodocytophaga rosea]QHT65788.1 hypothetical protein GXP67_03465 [Rhodocytophaga rosea]
MITLGGLLIRPTWNWACEFNIYQDKYWAWTYSLFTGIIVIIRILVQQWLNPLFLVAACHCQYGPAYYLYHAGQGNKLF